VPLAAAKRQVSLVLSDWNNSEIGESWKARSASYRTLLFLKNSLSTKYLGPFRMLAAVADRALDPEASVLDVRDAKNPRPVAFLPCPCWRITGHSGKPDRRCRTWVKFAPDSMLEGDGFEPSVPPQNFFGCPVDPPIHLPQYKPAPSRQGPMVRIHLPPPASPARG
jgi:hypothetical protein